MEGTAAFFLILIAVAVIIIYIRSVKNRVIGAIARLENELKSLEKRLPESKLPEKDLAKAETAFHPEKKPFAQTENPVLPPYVPPAKPPEIFPEVPVRPKVANDFEKFFGVNLLSKIGIATLVLGIGYFVKYAIDQNWINEIGRVALGILCGGILIGIAHKLKNKYRTFSSILVGGGISVLYITITIAFRDYAVFSQSLAFVLLILVTAVSVFLSFRYDRKELAIFSLLGGFASPLMVSSGTGNYLVLFSYILILDAGMLVLSFKKQWRIIGMIAYVLTQAFYWTWLLFSFEKENRIGATGFISLYFIQFYLMALLDYYHSKKQIRAFYLLIILSDNLLLYGSLLYVLGDYYIHIKGIITIGMAILNLIPLRLLYKDLSANKVLINMLIGLVVSFVTLAVPVLLSGNAITMFWAAEAVLLLRLWQKSDFRIFKFGFILVEVPVLISLLMDWSQFYVSPTYADSPVVFNRAFITGFVIAIAVWVNVYLLKKEKNKELIAGFPVANRIFPVVGTILLFLVFFLELQYRMGHFYENRHFRYLIYGLYFYLFTGILTAVLWKTKEWAKSVYGGVITCVLLYVLVYVPVILPVREDILTGELPGWGYLLMHCPALPSMTLFFIYALRKKKKTDYWLVCIVSVIILSMEADNMLLTLFHDGTNLKSLLNIGHFIIYPILWGITSFVLMIIGMKRKNHTLRLISLSLIGLIILKLYLYDIWQMGQTGRIIALVFLGILFLTVSFLYQKLKIVLKKDGDTK